MTLVEITSILTSSGPWGMVALVGWAFWRTQGRKELEIRRLYERIADLCDRQTAATIKMETSISSLTAEIRADRKPENA